MLAKIGALNNIGKESGVTLHRRDALWQAQKAVQPAGAMFKDLSEADSASPLERMTTEERLVADYRGTGVTVDRHPLFYRREELRAMGARTARELAGIGDGEKVRVAGCVIARQRPGTARGFIFMSLEDETGIPNVIITPDFYAANTLAVLAEPFFLPHGNLHNPGTT